MDKKIIKQKTVVAQVMEELKELIARGRFKPHDKIPPENELAEMFGVSRPTIREAIKIFNYLGVLESFTGKGTYVSTRENISTEALTWSILLGDIELTELIEIRVIIEERSLKKITKGYAADRTSVVDIIDQLDAQVEAMRESSRDFNPGKLTQADYDFHAAIIEGGRNSLFIAIYETLRSFMHEEISRTHQVHEHTEGLITQHDGILQAIKTGDPKEALKAFQVHMSSTCWQIFEETPDIIDV